MTLCATHHYDTGVHCVSDNERGEALAFCETLTAEKLQGLTVDEAAAINLYTQDSLYARLNDRLRASAGDAALESLAPFVGITRLLLAAMTKLPCVGEQLVYRGVREAMKDLDREYVQGQDFQWGQFTSCSRTSDTAVGFSSSTIFAVRCFAGCCVGNFSQYPSEHEVILPVGARLRVTGVMCLRNTTVIHLEQLNAEGRTIVEENLEQTIQIEEGQIEIDKLLAELERLRVGSASMTDEDILRLWRDQCPALQRLWPADAAVTTWKGLTFAETDATDASGQGRRVVEIDVKGKLGEVPEELGQLTALTKLNLRGNQLTSVPAELGRLTALTKLHLNNNKLTSVPAELGRLTALKGLALSGNQLTSVPAELGRLTALTQLALHENQLTSVPTELGQLTTLTQLNLRGNQLTSVPAELGRLTALTALNLQGNQLTSVPAELGRLTALTGLYLSRNQLTSVPAELGQLTTLTQLYLYQNQLTSVPVELGRLTALEMLYLDANQLTSVPAELGRLTALTQLYLYQNQLTSVPAELGRLTALTELYLHENQLTSVPAELGRLTALTQLYLHENQLTSVPAELGRLTGLKMLYLYGNKLTSVPEEWKRGAALKRSGCLICR
jgi:leucine-rich repeat protein SHOC2